MLAFCAYGNQLTVPDKHKNSAINLHPNESPACMYAQNWTNSNSNKNAKFLLDEL
jgi:hypothetical protein